VGSEVSAALRVANIASGDISIYIYIALSIPQRHSGGGGPAPKAATRVAASTPPPRI